MEYAPPTDRLPAFHQMLDSTQRFEAVGQGPEGGSFDDDWDVTRRVISGRLEVGSTSYPLRSTLVGFFYPNKEQEGGEFVVPGFSGAFVGHGRNVDDAYLDWRDRVHLRFQELYAMRPFEMNEEERNSWRSFESHIDVTVYRNTTPLMIRQVGKVGARARPLPEFVEWEDGHKEKVRPDQMPAEFATYRLGQPFEAVVSRDPVDFRLLEVVYIRRIRFLPQMRPEEFGELLHSILTTDSLPDADWE